MSIRVLCETLVMRDLDGAVAAWRDLLGWRPTARGEVTGKLAGLWDAAAEEHPRFALLASPGSDRGFVRLLEGPADDERGTFHHAGLFNAELLCADVDELHSRLEGSPAFAPLCPPTTYDLGSAGGAVSRSMATRGPGGAGVYVTTYVRVPPPRTLPPTPHLVCPMFNSALAVDDREDAESFFERVLGLGRRFAGYFSEPNINRLLDLPPDGGFDMVVYKGEGDGLIEVDFYDEPLPSFDPDRLPAGNSFLTLETSDFDDVVTRAEQAGRLARGAVAPDLPPYGGRRAALLRGPAGTRFEVIETEAPT
ncbi:MAG: VOC family protein [bacterium]|nr:VOC family protein [bacterium]